MSISANIKISISIQEINHVDSELVNILYIPIHTTDTNLSFNKNIDNFKFNPEGDPVEKPSSVS